MSKKKNRPVQQPVAEVTEVIEPVETVEEVAEEVIEVVEAEIVKAGKVVNCSKLNVRKRPVATAEVICIIDVNTEVVVDEEKSTAEFFKVVLNSGTEGYCMKKFIAVC